MNGIRSIGKRKRSLKGREEPWGGVLPYVRYIGMCRQKGMVFEPFKSENGYRF